jgi:hypothetical protein
MKKQIYFTIIGVGAILAIIGFRPGGLHWIWGILIAGITGVLYYFNRRTEQKVQERLEGQEKDVTQPTAESTPPEVPPESPDVSASGEEEPTDDDIKE